MVILWNILRHILLIVFFLWHSRCGQYRYKCMFVFIVCVFWVQKCKLQSYFNLQAIVSTSYILLAMLLLSILPQALNFLNVVVIISKMVLYQKFWTVLFPWKIVSTYFQIYKNFEKNIQFNLNPESFLNPCSISINSLTLTLKSWNERQANEYSSFFLFSLGKWIFLVK